MVCATAVPAIHAPTSDNAIANRSVLIVRVLSIKREVDLSTERVRVSLAAGLGTAFVRGRTTPISVTIATNRDRENPGLNRKGRKSTPNGAKRAHNDKL